MIRRARSHSFLVGLAVAAMSLPLSVSPIHGAAGCAVDAMLVFDGSASMAELDFDIQRKTRIVEARDALRDALPDITPFRRVGLLTYGPGSNTDSCANIDLRFGPRAHAGDAILSDVEAMAPKGLTALTASVLAASEALDYRRHSGIVVLVTDGNETCGGRPCALGTRLASESADLTVHVIGFKVVVDFFSWDNPEQQDVGAGNTVAKCLADRTGGLYVSTETVDELADALRVTLGCALVGQALPETKNAPRRTARRS